MEKILVINSGSSTLKFRLYLMPLEKELAEGLLDRIGQEDSEIIIKYSGHQKYDKKLFLKNHQVAIDELLRLFKTLKVIDDLHEITGVGHRVVAGGEVYQQSVIIDDSVEKKISELADLAPLHNPKNLIGIKEFRRALPHATAVAVFDTSFHQTIPEENYIYSTPYEWYQKYGVRRYGYHGTSHHYVALQAARALKQPLSQLKMITCHLGAGASMCAIKDGKSFDTSMGFTPLMGLTMATRSGDVDPSLIAYVMKKEHARMDQMITILNHQAGLLGISGLSPDMRDLIAAEKQNPRAALAIKLFINQIVRYVGQYYAEMGGLDALVFTAGIGENSGYIRQRVVERLKFMGIKLDYQKNNANYEGIITIPDSKIKVLRIATNEELMIAREVERLKDK